MIHLTVILPSFPSAPSFRTKKHDPFDRTFTYISISANFQDESHSLLGRSRYLEDIHLTATWQQFYANEPMEGIEDQAQQQRVLGGEACMWGEYIDGSALLNTAWPRAAAAAERLWSPRHYNDTGAVTYGCVYN